MLAIAKRDLKSYFSSPIGYVCVALILAFFGYFYFQVLMSGSTSYISSVYGVMFTWCMMVIPIITMRSMSEDRKNKTDQALLTAPVSVTAIVMGKFLASFAVYAIIMIGSLIPCIIMTFIADPNWGIIFGNFLASLLYGAAMIAIGVFIFSLTVSQIIAAIGTFAVAIFLMIIDSLGGATGSAFLSKVVTWISFNTRYSLFTQGLFSISNAVFFLSVAAIFIFLTARKLESRRWS